MKTVTIYGFVIAVLTMVTLTAIAEDRRMLSIKEQECYAVSMIGYDYVINSRVGVPMKRALNTVSVNSNAIAISDVYKTRLKKTVRKAYLWEGSPHDYAVKVLFRCAAKK